MTTSGVELSRSLFSQGDGIEMKSTWEAQGSPEPAEPPEPGWLAIGVALVSVLYERFIARIVRPAPDERFAFADYALGLALCLAMVVQFSWMAMRDGAPGFWGVYQLLNPIALPAFMATCGLLARRSSGGAFSSWLARALPFAGAIALWALVQIVTAWIAAPRGAMSVAIAMRSLGLMNEEIPLLLIVPGFMLLTRNMRNHHWFMLALAILAETLVLPGRTFGGECMRGLVYFYVGFLFGPKLRLMAREAKADVQMTICAIAVWLALAGLCAFIRVPFIGGATIVTLPLASLALGIAGALVLIMGSALLVQYRLFEPLAEIGRNWIVMAIALPLGLQGMRALLVATRAAPNVAAADLVIGVAAFAAFVALMAVAIVQFIPSIRAVEARPVAGRPQTGNLG